MSASQLKFCELYLSNGGDATNAYRQAFPQSANDPKVSQKAWQLKRHKGVAARLAEANGLALARVNAAVDQYAITAERVANEMALLAFTRMPQLADVRTELVDGKRRQHVVVRDFSEVNPEALAAISEVKRSPGGEISIKLYDKRGALMDIARLKGWIADKPVDVRQGIVFKVER